MKISVYSIYAFAILIAIGAAILSGIILAQTFNAQRVQSEAARHNTGLGQVSAVKEIVRGQLARVQTNNEALLRQMAFVASQLPPSAFGPDEVIKTLNRTFFNQLAPRIHAANELFGFGISFFYKHPVTGATYDRSIQVYQDVLRDGSSEYAFVLSDPNSTRSLMWSLEYSGYNLHLGKSLSSIDLFVFVKDTYMKENFFDYAYEWVAQDGYAYWFFNHLWHFQVHGVHGHAITYDLGVEMRNRMLEVKVSDSEFLLFDSNNMVLAATLEAEGERLASCFGSINNGLVTSDCIKSPAGEYPVEEIKAVYTELFDPSWNDLKAEPLAPQFRDFSLNGKPHLAVVSTLFAQGNLRMTIVWYQPVPREESSRAGLITLICILTVLSTLVLTLLGIFGILHPLMSLGEGMKAVVKSLKDGTSDASIDTTKHSIFREVAHISHDFETIVVDFLGFSSNVVRDNTHAPKDSSKPFAVVFTDIESSTRLWGKDPVAMSRCLQAHHTIIRELIKEHQLYEVKTVGDCFMVTSSSAASAIKFAVDIQMRLHAEDWSWKEADLMYCEHHGNRLAEVSSQMWNGLRVRIGVHYGMGDITYDEVSKGYDYYGTVVNAASRIEGIAHGGQVVVSEPALEAALQTAMDNSKLVVQPLGIHPLRGMSNPPPLVQILPASLAKRQFPPLRTTAHDDIEDAKEAHGLQISRNSSAASRRAHSYCVGPMALDMASKHSLARCGMIAPQKIARYLRNSSEVLLEAVRPLMGKQYTMTVGNISKAWGVPPPTGVQATHFAMLQVAQHISEAPCGLDQLQKMFTETKGDVHIDMANTSYVLEDAQ